jgi:hypothetical protein
MTVALAASDKAKIIARLYILIYKMPNEKLLVLLRQLEEMQLRREGRLPMEPCVITVDYTSRFDTHMIVARLFVLIRDLPANDLLHLHKQLERLFRRGRLFNERRHQRKACAIAVDFAVEGRAYTRYARDISMGGLFIESSEIFLTDLHLNMHISFPDHPTPFRIGGTIVRSDAEGIGIQFDQLTQVQTDMLRQLVSKIEAE